MPNRNGFEFCAALQADRTLRDVPVIFLSALDDPASRIEGLRAGAVDYITKPFYADEVVVRVRVHLRLREARLIVARQQQERLAELRQAQQSILVMPADLPDAAFAVCSRPLAEVGGDVYDVLQLGAGMFAYFVADVSGHGVGASFPTCAVNALLRQYSAAVYSAAETLRGINAVIGSILRDGQHLTACYARYSRTSKRLRFVSAGHPAPIHVSSSGRATAFPTESDPLGVFPSVILDEQTIPFEPGDRVYLYTDGLIEDHASRGGRASGIERLRVACEQRNPLPLEDVVDAITEDLRPSSMPAEDDLLLMGVEARA
jgi:sigma-B regulation protein RsbU (phosphoserine phosphatase)